MYPAGNDRSSRTLNRVGKPGLGAEICPDKKRLMRMFMDAIREVAAAQNAQMNAVLQGDSNFCDYEDMIHAAREKKDQAKYAYLTHIQEHGCHEGEETSGRPNPS